MGGVSIVVVKYGLLLGFVEVVFGFFIGIVFFGYVVYQFINEVD